MQFFTKAPASSPFVLHLSTWTSKRHTPGTPSLIPKIQAGWFFQWRRRQARYDGTNSARCVPGAEAAGVCSLRTIAVLSVPHPLLRTPACHRLARAARTEGLERLACYRLHIPSVQQEKLGIFGWCSHEDWYFFCSCLLYLLVSDLPPE
jgi:hypothetical protein